MDLTGGGTAAEGSTGCEAAQVGGSGGMLPQKNFENLML